MIRAHPVRGAYRVKTFIVRFPTALSTIRRTIEPIQFAIIHRRITFTINVGMSTTHAATHNLFQARHPTAKVVLTILLREILGSMIVANRIYKGRSNETATQDGNRRTHEIRAITVFTRHNDGTYATFFPLSTPLLITCTPGSSTQVITITICRAFRRTNVFLISTHRAIFLCRGGTRTITNVRRFKDRQIVKEATNVTTRLLRFLRSMRLRNVKGTNACSKIILIRIRAFRFRELSIRRRTLINVRTSITGAGQNNRRIRLPAILPSTNFRFVGMEVFYAP